MPSTARYTLTTTPTQVDVAADARNNRALTVIAQAAGTVVVCDDNTTDPTTEGARVELAAGGSLSFDEIGPRDNVWLAVGSGTLDVDVIETGIDS